MSRSEIERIVRLRYDSFLVSMTGLLGITVASKAPGGASRNYLAGMINHAISGLTQDVMTALERAIARACGQPDLSVADAHTLDLHLREIRQDAISLLGEFAQRDAIRVIQSYRAFVFSAATGSAGTQQSIQDARAQFSRRPVTFAQQGSTGSRFKSSDFAAQMLKHAVVRADIESKLFVIAKTKGDLAVVIQPDIRHFLHNKVFSITGTAPDLPSYEDIRSFAFHPNTHATVAAA